MIENCIAPGFDHTFEWIIAAFGSQLYQCKLCGLQQDVLEDSNP